jgi:hypothetical protein
MWMLQAFVIIALTLCVAAMIFNIETNVLQELMVLLHGLVGRVHEQFKYFIKYKTPQDF